MRIVALLKEVPDTGTRPDIANGRIVEETIKWVANPYDEYAVEAAVQLKEKLGADTEVVLVTIGKERARKTMEKILAMGPDRGLLIWDDALEGADAHAIAVVLQKVIESLGSCDLILAGQQGVDFNNAQTPLLLAERAGWPHVQLATGLDIDAAARTATVTSEIEGGAAKVQVQLPAVITTQKGLNEPRYPSLKDIMAVKKKPLDRKSLADLGLDAAAVAPRVALQSIVPPPPKQAGRIAEGAAGVPDLIAFLKSEAGVL